MRRATLVAVAVSLAACDARIKDESAKLPTAIAGAEIGGPQLIQRIRDFVDDSLEGRIPGTPGGVRTAETIAAEFRRLAVSCRSVLPSVTAYV